MAVMSHTYLLVLEWNSANRLTQAVALPDDDPNAPGSSLGVGLGNGLGSAESIFSAPFAARSAWSVASDFVGEVLGMLTMIIAINCLRRIALMMTNPFGDE